MRSNTSAQARRASTPTVRLVGWLEILVARMPFRLSHGTDRICGPNFPSVRPLIDGRRGLVSLQPWLPLSMPGGPERVLAGDEQDGFELLGIAQ